MGTITRFLLYLDNQNTDITDITPLKSIDTLEKLDIIGIKAANCVKGYKLNVTETFLDF